MYKIVWLHGLGDTAKGWYQSMLDLSRFFPFIKFILPTANEQPVTFANHALLHSWYDIKSTGANRNRKKSKHDHKGKEESVAYVQTLINHEIEQCSIDSKRVIVGGFSQGAAISIYCALLFKQQLACAISLSGYLLDFSIDPQVEQSLFMYHSKSDNVIPFHYAEESYQHLKKKDGLHVEFEVVNVAGHSINVEEMQSVMKHIKQALGASSNTNSKN